MRGGYVMRASPAEFHPGGIEAQPGPLRELLVYPEKPLSDNLMAQVTASRFRSRVTGILVCNDE